MSPVQICRRLGETRAKAIFLELTTDAMKKVLREAKVPTARMASHTTTRRRNEDWAARMWRTVNDPAVDGDQPLTVATPTSAAAATLLFEWLTRHRRPMLAAFLTSCGVAHDGGLTDADFLKETPPEKLVEGGKLLLEHHDKAEVAAYLLFLDASNASEIFAPLGLDKILADAALAPSTADAK